MGRLISYQLISQCARLVVINNNNNLSISHLIFHCHFAFSEVMSQQQQHEEGEGKESEDVQTGFSTKDFNLVKLHILSQSHIREIQ